jgi:hypothetical protein
LKGALLQAAEPLKLTHSFARGRKAHRRSASRHRQAARLFLAALGNNTVEVVDLIAANACSRQRAA